jgi:hypothetical protein
MRYVKLPSDMSVDSDLSYFNSFWDEAHATYASYYLLQNDGQFERAEIKKREADLQINTILQTESQEEGNMEISSYYSYYNVLSNRINPLNIE